MRRVNLPAWVILTGLIAFIVALTLALTSVRLHIDNKRELEEELGRRLAGVARTAALMIDGSKHEEIVSPEDFRIPEFKQIRSILRSVMKENGFTAPIYTLRRVKNTTEFVVMTDDPPYIGNRYQLREEMIPVFERGEATFTPLYTDQHGTWISAYAPIKTSRGDIVGLLDIDYSVETYAKRSNENLVKLAELSFVSFIIAAGLGILFSRSITSPVGSLINTMRHVIRTDRLDMLAPKNSNIQEMNELSDTFNTLTGSLRVSREKVRDTQLIAMTKLAQLAEKRDPETGEHLQRMAYFAKALAQRLKMTDRYRQYITDEWVQDLFDSAPLHDVGKVGVSDAILLKPGKLTEDEFEIMKTHASIGESILEGVEFLSIGKEIAGGHHEKWDGSGYPRGAKGEDIPLSARIVALADVYDALASKRVYKEAFSHDEAKIIILENRGKHFDPAVTQAFIEIEDEFIRIRKKYADS